MNFYIDDRPKETAGKRFDAYLDRLMLLRPYGMVECTIVCNETGRFKVMSSELDEAERLENIDSLEVFTDDSTYEPLFSYDQSKWAPFLEERGFKMVTRFPNSNSGNYVHVYHLVMDAEWMKQRKKGK